MSPQPINTEAQSPSQLWGGDDGIKNPARLQCRSRQLGMQWTWRIRRSTDSDCGCMSPTEAMSISDTITRTTSSKQAARRKLYLLCSGLRCLLSQLVDAGLMSASLIHEHPKCADVFCRSRISHCQHSTISVDPASKHVAFSSSSSRCCCCCCCICTVRTDCEVSHSHVKR